MGRLLRILAAAAFAFPLCAYAWLHLSLATDGKIHIRYMAWGNPEQAATDARLIDRFEQLHPNVKVDNTVVPWDFYHQKLQIMLASGTAPDVFKMDLYYCPKYFPYGYFKPVDEMAAGDPDFKLSDFHPVAVEEMEYKGHVLGLNTLFGGKIIYYNKALIRAAGLRDPYELYQEDIAHEKNPEKDPNYKPQWTLDTFVAYAKKMTIRNAKDQATQFGAIADTTDLWWIIWDFGGDILTRDGTVKVDQPEAIAGLTLFANMMNVDRSIPRANENSGGNFVFESGHVGMMTNWAGIAPRQRLKATFKWDIAPLPAGPKGRYCILKGNGFIVANSSPHPKEAWELLKFLTSPEAELAYCGPELRRAIPTRLAVAQSAEFNSIGTGRPPLNTGTFQTLYDNGRDLPVTPYWSEWQDHFNMRMEQMLFVDPAKRITPAEAAHSLAEEIRKVVRDFKETAAREGKDP